LFLVLIGLVYITDQMYRPRVQCKVVESMANRRARIGVSPATVSRQPLDLCSTRLI